MPRDHSPAPALNGRLNGRNRHRSVIHHSHGLVELVALPTAERERVLTLVAQGKRIGGSVLFSIALGLNRGRKFGGKPMRHMSRWVV